MACNMTENPRGLGLSSSPAHPAPGNCYVIVLFCLAIVVWPGWVQADLAFMQSFGLASEARPQSVISADLNGDGRPDLATANWKSDTVSVLLGNGDGTFQASRDFAAGSKPCSVAAADLNGDGRPDLATANSGDNTMSVLLGNGDGTFQGPRDYTAGNRPCSVAATDLNGDGRPDLATANSGDNTVSVLVNTSTP
jgi:hypothetical protein